MNKLKTNNYFGEMWKSVVLVGLFSLLITSLSASSNPTAIVSALSGLCGSVKGLLGVAVMLMIILAAVTYAAGQIMGAETRARATVWATAMFTGAIFAAVIYLIVPYITKTLGLTAAC